FASSALLQLTPRGLEHHLSEPAFERELLRWLSQINCLSVESTAEPKRSDPFAGLVDRVLPAQILMVWRLIAFGMSRNETRSSAVRRGNAGPDPPRFFCEGDAEAILPRAGDAHPSDHLACALDERTGGAAAGVGLPAHPGHRDPDDQASRQHLKDPLLLPIPPVCGPGAHVLPRRGVLRAGQSRSADSRRVGDSNEPRSPRSRPGSGHRDIVANEQSPALSRRPAARDSDWLRTRLVQLTGAETITACRESVIRRYLKKIGS